MRPDIPTLHRRIVAEIVANVRSGRWPPGYRIPTEHELAAGYGCSRATVSKAIGELVASGLVERRKRAGSFIASPPLHAGLLGIPDIRSAIVERGEPYAFRLVSRRTGHASAGWKGAGTDVPGPVLSLEGLHFAAGRPFAHEWREISLTAAPGAATVDFSDEPPGTWLLGHIPWTEGKHRVAAITPEPQVQRHLALDTAQACLLIERWTWRLTAPVTHARQVFVGDRFDLVGNLAPVARDGG